MAGAAARLVVCATGLKGAVFVDALFERGLVPGRIVSYEQPDDRANSYARIRQRASDAGVAFETNRRPGFTEGALAFLVGWQYLLPEAPGVTAVVFHDSLLPKYRGFSPTVAALIAGETKIGVTALLLGAGIDEGPILGQAVAEIRYPMKIADALTLQAGLMAVLAIELEDKWRRDALESRPQDDTQATYSLWRDAEDYFIDWTRPADEIARMIDASGFPYDGARTRCGSEEIIVDAATPVADLAFASRAPGKVWRFDAGQPVVVCGAGLLRLDACRTRHGAPFMPERLRTRLR